MKYKTHKIDVTVRTECGLSVFDVMGVSEFWKYVDCKWCLKIHENHQLGELKKDDRRNKLLFKRVETNQTNI